MWSKDALCSCLVDVEALEHAPPDPGEQGTLFMKAVSLKFVLEGCDMYEALGMGIHFSRWKHRHKQTCRHSHSMVIGDQCAKFICMQSLDLWVDT